MRRFIVLFICLLTIGVISVHADDYLFDEAGKFGPKNELVKVTEYLGTEKINGVTVTKMKSLLDGKITGTDMYGNQYGIKDGKLTIVK